MKIKLMYSIISIRIKQIENVNHNNWCLQIPFKVPISNLVRHVNKNHTRTYKNGSQDCFDMYCYLKQIARYHKHKIKRQARVVFCYMI